MRDTRDKSQSPEANRSWHRNDVRGREHPSVRENLVLAVTVPSLHSITAHGRTKCDIGGQSKDVNLSAGHWPPKSRDCHVFCAVWLSDCRCVCLSVCLVFVRQFCLSVCLSIRLFHFIAFCVAADVYIGWRVEDVFPRLVLIQHIYPTCKYSRLSLILQPSIYKLMRKTSKKSQFLIISWKIMKEQVDALLGRWTHPGNHSP